jgi:thioredoxin reductase
VADIYDVIIAGGGAAGLSAALVLGRCRRRILLYDDGRHRNSASHAIHCLLGQEGTPPRKLYAAARGELQQYETVTLRPGRVTEISPVGSQFSVTCSDGSSLTARKILLATGLKDVVPKLDGIEPLYGRSVHHCPYCDGFEHRDEPLAVYGAGDKGAGLALMMRLWSSEVVLCTDGQGEISPGMQERLRQHDIVVHTEKIDRLEGTNDGNLDTIHLHGGMALKRSAMFFTTGCFRTPSFPSRSAAFVIRRAASSAAVSPKKAAFPASMLRVTHRATSCSSLSPLPRAPRRAWRSIEH